MERRVYMRRRDWPNDLTIKDMQEACDYLSAKRIKRQHRFWREFIRQLQATTEYKYGS